MYLYHQLFRDMHGYLSYFYYVVVNHLEKREGLFNKERIS